MTSKYHHNQFISQIFNENMLPLFQKLSLKSLSEQNIKMVAMALLLIITQSHTVKSLAHLIFRLFGWDYDVSARLWCHYMGIPCQNWGNPLKIAIFSQFHLVICILITKLNVTIPVLFKTSFKYRFHPLAPLAPPLAPPPLPHSSCLHPLPPFHNPFPDNLAPPCQK